MAGKKDYYGILGIKKNATASQIKKAYREMAMKWHPDKWSSKSSDEKEKAERMFKEINEANEVLSDQNKKWDYDHAPDKPDYGDGKEGSEFECAGCHNKSTYHYNEELKDKDNNRLIFHSYDCLFDCANPLCISGGKCVKRLVKTKTDGNFCSRDCLNDFRKRRDEWGGYDPDQNVKKCCKCSDPVGDSTWTQEGWPICISCATEKCIQCGKQGIPTEGSGWIGYSHYGWYCCREHYQLWKKDKDNKDNQNQEQESEEEISEPPQQTKPPKIDGNTNQKTGSETEEDYSDNDSSDHDSESDSDSDSNHIPNQNENGETKELPKNIQAIANLSLPQAQLKAEQEIEKILKDNGISEQELNTEKLLNKGNWKNYLKHLDSPQKIAQFTYQMQQAILKKALTKRIAANREEKKPQKDGWIKPSLIIVLSLLALSTLTIIVRQRRKKVFNNLTYFKKMCLLLI